MIALIRQLSLSLFKRKILQLSILVSILAIGIFSTLSYQNFLYLQAQNISMLSAFNEILKPLSGLVLLTQLFLISMASSQLAPYFRARGQQGLILHSALSNLKLTLSYFWVVFIIGFLPAGYFLLIGLSYLLSSELDIRLLLSTSFALLVGNLIFSPLILSVSLYFKKPLTAFVICMSLILVIFAIDEFLRNQPNTQLFSVSLDLFVHLRDGAIVLSELVGSLLWGLLFASILIFSMQKFRFSSNRLGQILLVISLLLFSVHWYLNDPIDGRESSIAHTKNQANSYQWDISRSKINSLQADQAKQLAAVKQAIIVTAVIDDEKNHDEIRQAFEVIHQYQPNSTLTFRSRQSFVEQSQMVGQFVSVKIANQQQSIRYPFEQSAKQSLSQVIIQLTTRSNQWLTFIEGHGEASPFGSSSRDISQFYQSLKQLGWPVAMQNLRERPVITDNTKVLVIVDSQEEWLHGELNGLMDYLEKGGNLLLLRESNDQLPQELSSFLAIRTIDGTLIDWMGYQSGTPHPAIVIVNQFNSHPANTGINSLLAFPWSVGLEIDLKNKKDFNEYHLINETHSGVWNELNSQEVELAFDPEKGEKRQNFNLAYSIKNKNNGQRIIVVGDSSFLSDSAINNYANRQFSLNLISWLSAQDVDSLQTNYQDNFIVMNPYVHFMLSWLFSLILPMLLITHMLIRIIRKKRLPIAGTFDKQLNEPSNE